MSTSFVPDPEGMEAGGCAATVRPEIAAMSEMATEHRDGQRPFFIFVRTDL